MDSWAILKAVPHRARLAAAHSARVEQRAQAERERGRRRSAGVDGQQCHAGGRLRFRPNLHLMSCPPVWR